MEWDGGGVDDFHEGSKYFVVLSPENISEKRKGQKDTEDVEDNWGEGSLIMGLYGETYLTGVDGTV